MSGFEENEVSKNANGGTEISKRSLQSTLPAELLDECQIISSRIRELQENKIRVLTCHDLAEDPELNHLRDANSRNRFHKIVFVSNWQLDEFVTKLGITQDETISVIENPIKPIELVPKSKEQINLIYFSTPQRGLEILVPVFEELSKKYDNVHLDVYSSFLIYGWKEMDEQFNPLYDRIKNHPKMTYHGYAPQEQITEALKKAHILAYPCIWKETSCRTLMESMSAGLVCVHPNFGALPETSGGLTSMYQYVDDKNKHAAAFFQNLEHAISVVNEERIQNYLKFVKTFADMRYNIDKISQQWQYMLTDLKNRYPTEDSRKIPGKVFVYKTS